MPSAAELEIVPPGAAFWRYYDRRIRTELFSTALQTETGTFVIDPIAADAEVLSGLHNLKAILITNENHQRAAADFSQRFAVPIFSNPGEFETNLLPSLRAIPIAGAPSGEIAVFWDAHGGTMVIGDALINFDPYGFTFLPRKYCLDAALMKRSLAKLLDFPFQRMFFAHGAPIVSHARDRLDKLLQGRA